MLNKSEAKRAGKEAGYNAATWAFDGNTPEQTLLDYAVGFLIGDPLVMDQQPSPLSGEWAGGSINEILDVSDEDAGRRNFDEKLDGVAEAYERAFSEAYWKQWQKEIPRRVWTKARKEVSNQKWEQGKRVARHNASLDKRRDSFDTNPPKFSRQDFQLIADIVSALPRQLATEGRLPWTRDMIAFHFAERLAITNPRFDDTRFLRACGVGSDVAAGNRR